MGFDVAPSERERNGDGENERNHHPVVLIEGGDDLEGHGEDAGDGECRPEPASGVVEAGTEE